MSDREPLPSDQWVTDIPTFAEARAIQRELSGRWLTRCGRGDGGFYVAAPGSGLSRGYCADDADGSTVSVAVA